MFESRCHLVDSSHPRCHSESKKIRRPQTEPPQASQRIWEQIVDIK